MSRSLLGQAARSFCARPLHTSRTMARAGNVKHLFQCLHPGEAYSKEKATTFARELREIAELVEKNEGLSNGGRRKGSTAKQMDFSTYRTRYVALELLYIGHDFSGFARQEKTATETIEGALFSAMKHSRLIPATADWQELRYSRAGRTDRGVSALRQVIVLDLRSAARTHEPIPAADGEINYPNSLNRVLPETIRVTAWADAPEGFSARFSAIRREYKYLILQPKMERACLDLGAMREAASHFIGTHDFRNFCKIDVAQVRHFQRTMLDFRIEPLEGSTPDGTVSYALHIKGTAFLWHQVRCMAAVLLMVGRGEEDPSIVKRLLEVNLEPRKPMYSMAPDEPLFLFKCAYEEDALTWHRNRTNLDNVLETLRAAENSHTIRAGMISEMVRSLEGDEGVFEGSEVAMRATSKRAYVPLLKRVREPALGERAGAANGFCEEAAIQARALGTKSGDSD